MKIEKIGSFLTLFFIVFLPWSVMISVTGVLKLDIQILRYWKEVYLIILCCILAVEMYRKRIPFKYDIIDILVVLFGLYLVLITFLNHGSVASYVYGLRYDLEFLVAFLVLRRLFPLYRITIAEISRLFLVSGGLMIVTALVFRYVIDDSSLTIFGFDPQFSGFSGGDGWPPKIYYLIEGTDTIRFQGLLEGPNQMAYFLLVYIGVFWFYFWHKKSYRFLFVLLGTSCLYLLFITYSRSAFVGALGAVFFTFLLYLRNGRKEIAWKKLLGFIFVVSALVSITGIVSYDKVHLLLVREGSTSAHFERMMIGINRFVAHPYGVGLGEAGPASRGVYDINNDKEFTTDIVSINNLVQKIASRNPRFFLMSEYFYIPESWYIQQLIQGGIIGLLLFVSIMGVILVRIVHAYPFAWMFSSVLIMNLFLHSFEAIHVSLLLFTILSILCPVQYISLKHLGKKYFSF